MSFIAMLFAFGGRINRAKYWLVVVFWTVIFIIAVTFAIYAVGTSGIDWSADTIDPSQLLDAGLLPTILMAALFIIVSISGLAVGAKRLHDRDKTAWWILLYYFGPAILQGLADYAGSLRLAFIIAAFVLSLWALIDLGFLRGTAGPNRFGPDPLGGAAPAVAARA
jgi:uncharacterized membrane protein YhaH (DUF805 family)